MSGMRISTGFIIVTERRMERKFGDVSALTAYFSYVAVIGHTSYFQAKKRCTVVKILVCIYGIRHYYSLHL